MNFSEALEAMKKGKKVRRTCFMQNACVFSTSLVPSGTIIRDAVSCPAFVVKHEHGDFSRYQPCDVELFANDWEILDDEKIKIADMSIGQAVDAMKTGHKVSCSLLEKQYGPGAYIFIEGNTDCTQVIKIRLNDALGTMRKWIPSYEDLFDYALLSHWRLVN